MVFKQGCSSAKVGDLSTIKQIARERTLEPLKNQLKGGEFRRSGRKISGRRRRRRRRKKEKKKKVKYRKRSWWKKCKERIARFLTAKRNEEEKETKGRKSDKRPRTRQFLGKSGRLLFLLVLLAQNWLYVNAAAEGLQKRTEILERWQQQRFQAKEGRWVEEIPQRWKQPTGEDRTEMKKEARALRWTLLDGSAWSTETKYMIKCKGKCAIFFGIEHRLRKEEMEEPFNKEVKEKDGDLQQMQREKPTKLQAARIVSIHQEEFLWQSTATWEQLWEWCDWSRSQDSEE